MDTINFDDLHQRRATARAQVNEKRRRLQPLIPFGRAALGISRLLGFEQPLFQRRFQPLAQRFADRIEHAFTGYTPTTSDVIVCSYFKSGTHWMMQIAHQIAHQGEGEYDNIYDVIPWNEGPNPLLGMPLTDPRPLQLSPTGLRVIKTHAAAEYVPYNDKARYICVIRDPKDVFVSSFHFIAHAMLGHLRPSLNTWLNLYLSKQAFWGPWAEFTASYWPWRDRPNVHFVTYEQIQHDKLSTIREIAAFMGVDLSDDELARVDQLSSYQHMKDNDHKYHQGVGTPFSPPAGRMVRRGKKGTSGELLSPQQQTRIDDYCRQNLIDLGSDFPYDQFYGAEAEIPPE
ncbi:MAG: sulfotransferase domain-containing protein [Immundisolibacteraceae bacterium]|nr:sulfotransferase domain-containing protein [Immundisolibacteraceae bacterium]